MTRCSKCGQFGHAPEACTYVPQSRKGVNLGGITDLSGIKNRCRINEDTECWEWMGAVTSATAKSMIPVAWFPADGRLVSVPRKAFEFSTGTKVNKRMVWRTCGCATCVNPEHLKSGTRKEWGCWLKRTGAMKNKITPAKARAAVIARGAASLTMELAQWARESTQTGREVARVMGVSEQQISRARRMQTWAPTAVGASVFSWAANEGRKAA